jgi:predicted MFS family arabinose efflux permease
VLLLAVPAGQLADRVSRRGIVLAAQVAMALCSVALALVSRYGFPLWTVYALMALVGVANAFSFPARQALLPQLIEGESFHNAVTWRSGAWQVAAMLGPALGGLGIWLFGGASPVFLADAICGVVVSLLLAALRPQMRSVRERGQMGWQSFLAGFSFVARTRLILASITLDMFAVLLGGAVAMLPFFAKDILHVGEMGFGVMRAAPAAGALLMALWLAHRPPLQRSGLALIAAVVGFGVATIVFALSRSPWLSFLMLAATGALDNISVVVRSTLIQVRTPDAMRGRVSAVNSVFIGMSNELGAFESGAAARLVGLVPSVVFGGVGSIVVALLCPTIWPEMARLGALDKLGDEGDPDLAAAIPCTALEVEGHQ